MSDVFPPIVFRQLNLVTSYQYLNFGRYPGPGEEKVWNTSSHEAADAAAAHSPRVPRQKKGFMTVI